ncbi:hypothetical protein OAO01_09145, partial [Oligoflexia bacterium]|nr:hypothetical protein [Oligoflexia bacterium]
DTHRATVDFEVGRHNNSVTPIHVKLEGKGNNDSAPDNGSGPDTGTGDVSNDENTGGETSDKDEPDSPEDNGADSGNENNNSDKKTTICHKPDSKNPNTLTINADALDGHLAHGDSTGACPDKPEKKPKKEGSKKDGE